MNVRKLKARILEYFGTQEAFAGAMGMSPFALSARMTGRVEWSRAEIAKALTLLEIPVEETHIYFFADLRALSHVAE